VTPGPHRFKNDYIDEAHAADTEGALFRPVSNNRTVRLVAGTLPAMVPNYRNPRDWASLGLGTPPFLTVPIHTDIEQGGTLALVSFRPVLA
jgi:hypothetical protein